jgi:hypothetical protein
MAAERSNDKIKRLKRQKLLSKDKQKRARSQRVESDCILFLLLSMVMLDFTWWPDAEEEAGKSPLSTNHAATRFSGIHLPCLTAWYAAARLGAILLPH